MAVDLDASFHCAQAAIPHLRRAGGGHIVLFSDWVAASGRPRYRGYLPYYVAKRAVARARRGARARAGAATASASTSSRPARSCRPRAAPRRTKPRCSRRPRWDTGAARTKWRARSSRSSGRPSSPARRSGSMAGVTWAARAAGTYGRSTVLATSTGHPVGCADPCSVSLQLGSLRPTVGIGLPTPIHRSSLHAADCRAPFQDPRSPPRVHPRLPPSTNGQELSALLRAMQAVANGDFSVRLPGDWTGLDGKIADTFNDIVAANAEHGARARARRDGGRQAGQDPAARPVRLAGRRLGRDGDVGQHADRRPAVADHRSDARASPPWPRATCCRPCASTSTAGRSKGEFLRSATIVNTMIEQLGVFTSEVTRVAREVGTDGKLGGQAQVPRRQRRLEGPDRQRQLDGQQPDRPGAQHLRGDDRGRQRRPVEEDHRRRARRDPAAQGSHQHDGRPAALVRVGSDARGARGRHRRQARRPGGRARRRRHVEGPDRLGQRDGAQPDRPGAQHRRGDDRRRARRPVAQDHGRRARRDPRAEEHHQHDGRPAQRVRRRR